MYEAFNARRFEDLDGVLDADVVMVLEGTSLLGLTAVRDYLAGLVRQAPIRVKTKRIFEDCRDMLFSLAWVVDTSAAASEHAAHGRWTHLVVHRIAAGRVVEWRAYLIAEDGAVAKPGLWHSPEPCPTPTLRQPRSMTRWPTTTKRR